MSEIENKILSFLDSGYKIDDMIKELNIDKESLADIIIELDTKGLVCLKNKNWILTQKGNDVLNKIKESLKDLKFSYLDGNISRDEFLEKRKKLEDIICIERLGQYDNIVTKGKMPDKTKEKNINCSKCGSDNNVGSKYCYKCGAPLSNV